MLLFGHRFIPSKVFYHVSDIDSINKTPPSSFIFLEFDEDNLDIINHASLNSVHFALEVKNITEIIYASALNASFIVVSKELATTAQTLANNYLFDAKILVMIENEEEIEELALLEVDGVLFSDAIVRVST